MSLFDAYAYCAREARRFDYDRYLTLMFAPQTHRPALAALLAFNLEVAKTREIVSEPLLGQMRLQWWREAFDGIYAGTARQHEVVQALADAIAAYDLPRAPFDVLLEARERDLDDTAPADMAALRDYAEATSGSLTRQMAAVLAPGDLAASGAAALAGTAWALTGLIRAIPFHARARRTFIPLTVMEERGLTEATIFAVKPTPELNNAVRTMAEAASQEVAAAREALGQAGRRTPAVTAMLALNDLYLARLRRAGYDVFGNAVQVGNARKQAHLMWRSLAGKLI